MAVTRILANNFKLALGQGLINFASGDFRVILMNSAFAFDRDTHATYGDISTDELAAGNGYAQITKALTATEAWAQDNAADKAAITWANPTWEASTGSLGPTGAAVVLQYNSGTPAGSIIVGCIDFGEDITVTDGVSFQLQNMGFDLRQGT